MTSLIEAWSLAQKQVHKAQKAHKKNYDRKTKDPAFRVDKRVFVYMPGDKSSKAYKLSQPFHGPFRMTEVLDAGVVVCPVDRPQEQSIRVALNRMRHCPEAIREEATLSIHYIQL